MSGARILIVEDQRLIAADLENTLQKLGYTTVGVAPTGEEAVQKAGSCTPELVLMDIRLRGDMDGIEAAGIIRERYDLPVVYLTAYADEETLLRAKLTTPFGYVVKPFNERELRAAIEIALYKHKTDRKLAEERARRRLTEEAGLLVDSVEGYAIIRLDRTGHVAAWNHGAERLTGHGVDDILGAHFSMLMSEEAQSAGEPDDLLANADREGRADHEGWLMRKDGSRFWCNLSLTGLAAPDGERLGFAVVVRDLSEREAYRQAVRDSEQRFRAAVTHAPVPMMLHSEDGEVLAMSDAVLRETGYSREQLRTTDDWLELAYRERAPEIRELVARAFSDGAAPPQELVVVTASGERRNWLFCLSEPMMLGQRRGIVAVAVDLTDQRRVEEALKDEHRHKDEFIAMLGHELRNPLAAIRTATELMKLAAQQDQKLQRVQDVLERQTANMAKLIDGLLDVSRIVGGRIALDQEVCDLQDVLQEVMQAHVSQLEHRGVALRVESDPHPLWVRGDRVRLAQTFENLLSNAVKFTPKGGHIAVEARAAKDRIVVRIRDTGPGIDAALLPHIFEPFRQAEQNMARTTGGLGLGLAIVKGLVELHGGSVEVDCPPEGGAVFTVSLPRSPPPEERTTKPPEQPGASRVLIVEDNQDAADTLRTVLETIGNQVEVAYDGESAVKAARRFDPQVVLCDIGLPGMSGYDVARELRQAGQRCVLVAVTGYGRPEDIERAGNAGFDAHLTKPIAVTQIQQLLAEHRVPDERS